MPDLDYSCTLENFLAMDRADSTGVPALDKLLKPAVTQSPPKLSRILTVMRSHGYTVSRNPRGLDVNIVGIRSSSRTAGKFDDWITLFWMDSGTNDWVFHCFAATTDPSARYMKMPLRAVRRKGTAVLKPGQYRGAYRVGKHRGRYTALVLLSHKRHTIYSTSSQILW